MRDSSKLLLTSLFRILMGGRERMTRSLSKRIGNFFFILEYNSNVIVYMIYIKNLT